MGKTVKLTKTKKGVEVKNISNGVSKIVWGAKKSQLEKFSGLFGDENDIIELEDVAEKEIFVMDEDEFIKNAVLVSVEASTIE